MLMKANDVIVHTKDWGGLIAWIDACSKWEHKKNMHWESTKCTVICRNRGEVEDDRWKFYIGGGI